MSAEDQPKFLSIRNFLIGYHFHPKVAVLAARVYLDIDSEEQAWKCLDFDQQPHYLEALKFLRESKS
jgi:hypothetical protein